MFTGQMIIWMTGASGFIGRALKTALLGLGHEILETSHGSRGSHLKWNYKTDSVPQRCLEAQAVIHLAGENIASKRWSESQKKEIYDSRVLSTSKMVTALSHSQKLKVFISASAIGFYGDRESQELTEQSAAGQGFLSKVCQDWESALLKSEGSYRKVCVRTGIVLGRNGGALEKMKTPFSLGLGGPIGDGKQWQSWIHLDDIVKIYVTALENENLAGPINAVTAQAVTNLEFTKTLAKVLNRPAILRVPKTALKIALGEMSQILLSSQRVLPQRLQEINFHFEHPNLELALKNILI